MRLYQKLVLVLLAAALVPPSLVGFRLLAAAEAALTEQIEARQQEAAAGRAERLKEWLGAGTGELSRAAATFPLAQLTPDERDGALALAYGAVEDAAAVVLVDGTGRALARAAFHTEPARDPATATRQAFPATAVAPLQQRAAGALGGNATPGAVLLLPAFRDERGAHVPVVTVVAGPEGAPAALAAELSFARLDAELRARRPGTARLRDAGGTILAGAEPPEGAQLRARAEVAVPGLGWVVEAEVPAEAALQPVREMRRAVLVSVTLSLGLLLVLAGLFAGRLGRRIALAEAGALEFARGNLTHRLPVTGKDELDNLARTMNSMGEDLHAARGKLERWNEDLRAEVEKRTAELRAAQAQLVETQKLAAIGQLGAGVAHEINNPLAGILGYAQLLLVTGGLPDKTQDTLRKMEQLAKRCREITQSLLRFSQQKERPDFREVELGQVVGDALKLVGESAAGEGITVAVELAPGLPPVLGDSGHLEQVVLHLVANARTALANRPEKRLAIRTRLAGDRVILEVEDSGKGIAPEHLARIFEPFFTTKDVWTNVGLGLSVTYRIVAEHQGKISAETEVGRGTRMVVELPAVARRPQGGEATKG